MAKIRANLVVVGENFSPKLFTEISSIKLLDTVEPNSILKVGRFKGKPSPNGSAVLAISDQAKGWKEFDELLCLIEKSIDALRETNAEEMVLSFSFYHDGQCNFGFTPNDLKRIANLGIDFNISCYLGFPEKVFSRLMQIR